MLSYSMTLIRHGDWLASMVGRRSRDWQLLQHLHSRHSIPWLCPSGFNEILTSKEKQGGLQKPLNLVQAFRASLLHCGLVDLGFRGNMFTWNSGVRDLDQKKCPSKKIFGYLLRNLSFWVSGMESPVIFSIQKIRKTKYIQIHD